MINVFISIIIKVYPVVFVVTGATKKVAAGAEVLRIPSAPMQADYSSHTQLLFCASATTNYYYSITVSFLQDVFFNRFLVSGCVVLRFRSIIPPEKGFLCVCG